MPCFFLAFIFGSNETYVYKFAAAEDIVFHQIFFLLFLEFRQGGFPQFVEGRLSVGRGQFLPVERHAVDVDGQYSGAAAAHEGFTTGHGRRAFQVDQLAR